MAGLEELLPDDGVLVSDGAWGTELANRGLGAGVVPESWNLDRPDDVKAVAASYVEAGSDIILTNSFGGSRVKLEKGGLADRTAEVNRLAASLSKEAAGDRALVFASMGPTGEFLQPLGLMSEGDMIAVFREQAEALAEGGADGFIIETFIDLAEAKAALAAAKEVAGLPVVVSMTFEKGARGYATVMGVTPEVAAAELEAAGADGVGSNCGNGIDNIIEVARLMRPATSLPLWMKPNAGVPELVGGETVFKQSPAEMAALVGELIEAGAGIVGGCCGSTPDHIRAIAGAARKQG